MDVMPFDELNKFVNEQLPTHFDESGHIRSKQDEEDIIDELLDLFLLAYANGEISTNESLGSDIKLTSEDAMSSINREIAGKTWEQRVRGYFDNDGTIGDIIRIAETESHRDSNESAYLTAKAAGATKKIWHCSMLPTSRDTHIYLNNVSAPIDGEFYSFRGGSTLFPGQWGIAEEDVNCLCWLTYEM